MTTQDMADTYLPAFHACVAKGRASSIMCSYNSINGVPACADADLLTGLARCVLRFRVYVCMYVCIHVRASSVAPPIISSLTNADATINHRQTNATRPNPHSGAWGFDGYITSDCGAVADIWNRHNYTATPEETCGVALRAGTDLDCSTFYKDHAPAALASGDLRKEDVDAALRHLFRVQFRLGLFDPSDGQVYTKVGGVEWGGVGWSGQGWIAASFLLAAVISHTLSPRRNPVRPGQAQQRGPPGAGPQGRAAGHGAAQERGARPASVPWR